MTWRCVFTLNARDTVLLDVLEDEFALDAGRLHLALNQYFDEAREVLKKKSIAYSNLRAALVPSQTRHEVAVAFDTAKLNDVTTYPIFLRLLPLFGRKSKHSLLSGFYIEHTRWPGATSDHQTVLLDALIEALVAARTFAIRHSSDVYLVYINNLTPTMIRQLHESLTSYAPYLGYVDLTCMTWLKAYLSLILPAKAVLDGRNVLIAHEDDVSNDEDYNVLGWPFDEVGLRCRSVQSSMFDLFYSYKIERPVVLGEHDRRFGLNIVSRQPSDLTGFGVRLKRDKLSYLLEKKRDTLARAGLDDVDASQIEEIIRRKIASNYVYNLCFSESTETVKFNTILEFADESQKGCLRLLLALEYMPTGSEVRVITMY